MSILTRVLIELFTLADNHTPCLSRALWAISLVAFIMVGCIQVVKTGNINLFEFGGGICAILGGGGIAIRLKDNGEPKGH